VNLKDNLVAIAGAVAGGLVGCFAFFWAARQGLYSLVLPGALVGLGAGVSRNSSVGVSVFCGLFGLAIGFFSEWRFAPFVADEGLGYFLSHVHELRPVTLIMIAVGAAIAFWVPFRRRS
jgi:hypothetical protein